jgi:phosphate transport system substrate-binding protein
MKTIRKLTTSLAAGALLAAVAGPAAADRSQIRVVGSSTVYPFSSYVAEEFGATTGNPTPVVESTGSGGGMKLFCAGNGMDTPDITNSSRRMKTSEYKRCQDNGVTDITEFKIGFDGIVVAQAKGNKDINLSREQITLAVAAKVPQGGELVDNPYTRWNQIDSSLPDRKIEIYGPPTTSGTRDAFEELTMEAVTEDMGYGGEYTDIRSDGAYVDSGENDNLIVQKITQNKDAFGIFGYSFLEENRNKVKAATVDGVVARPDTISSGEYPVSRSMFFYTKNTHFDRVPGMEDYVRMFISERMIGPRGLLKDLGLIALPDAERDDIRARLESRAKLKLADLE